MTYRTHKKKRRQCLERNSCEAAENQNLGKMALPGISDQNVTEKFKLPRKN